MDGPPQGQAPSHVVPWLTLQQQRLIALLIVAAQLGIIGWWVCQGGIAPGLIRLDRATPLKCQSRLDINQCDWPELTLLPGISETMARRIVRDRSDRGPFTEVDELRRVRGIGPKKLARLKAYVVCQPPRHLGGQPANSGRADEATEKP